MSVTTIFTLNGKLTTFEVEASEILTDTLRQRCGLTGTKKSCGTGDCGSCTVIVDGEAVRSCILLTASMHGKSVTTIEGLGNMDNPHVLQQIFVEVGAVQCGYCTPGMVLTAKALLDRNPHPTKEEIKEALSGNLCRCTGYTKIALAVSTAAERGVS